MPKHAEYQITWSEKEQAYVLQHALSSFSLTENALQSWLNFLDAFHFQAPSGQSLLVRKETRQRGTAYWCAYRRVEGKLRKKYLGAASKVTLALLGDVARALVAPPESKASFQHQSPPPRQPVFQFTKTLTSALTIFGFSVVPAKTALISRYRELVKEHHPDKGGLHQDMVAVNLAYELLKSYTW